MQPRLKKAEATAGIKKTLLEFSIPITKAVMETMVMNGYMICTRVVQSFKLTSLSQPGFKRRTNQGANATPAIAMTAMKQSESASIFLPSAHAASSPSFLIFFVKVVTKAVDRAPSANRSRSMFGVLKAAVKMPVKWEPKSPFKS